MITPDFIIRLDNITVNGSLSTFDILRIRNILESGGLILLPSDTCYSLAAITISEKLSKNINSILNREDDPISIAFPNFKTVEKYVSLQPLTALLLEKFTPGCITVVCKVSSELRKVVVNGIIRSKDDTIGVRIPDSNIEREIAGCSNFPITTVAIRDKQKNIVKDFEEAVKIVSEGINCTDSTINWAAIEWSMFYNKQSTVVRVNENSKQIQLLRSGNIPFEDIVLISNYIPISMRK